MAECAIARCVQERRSFKKELQKWGKNVLFLVGLERVAEELVGRDKWKRLSAPINELENQLVTDWEPESVCCFCNNTKQLSDPSKGICSLDSLSNYNNGADSDGQMSEVFKIKVRSPDTVAKREFDFMDLDEMKGNIEVTKLKGHSRKILTASRKLEDVKNKETRRTPSPMSDQPLDLSMGSKNTFYNSHSSPQSPATNENGEASTTVLKVPQIPLKPGMKKRLESTGCKRSYTEEELQAALRDIQSGKLGTRRAAVIYGIPRSTLRNKVYKLAMERDANIENSSSQKEKIASLSMEELVQNNGGMENVSASESLRQLLRNRMVDRMTESKPTTAGISDSLAAFTALSQLEYSQTLAPLLANVQELALARYVSGADTNSSSVSSDILSEISEKYHLPLLPDLIRRLAEERFEEERGRLNPDSNTSVSQNGVTSASNASDEQGSTPKNGIPNNNVILKIPSYKPMKSFSGNEVQTNISSGTSQTSSGPALAGKGIGVSLREIIAKSITQRVASNKTVGQVTVKNKNKLTSDLCNGSSDSSNLDEPQAKKLKSSNNANADKNKKNSDAKTEKRTRPKRGRYRNYDRDNLVEAVRAVQRGEMSVHRAGSYYGVPHSTLEYKVKERHLLRPRKRDLKNKANADANTSLKLPVQHSDSSSNTNSNSSPNGLKANPSSSSDAKSFAGLGLTFPAHVPIWQSSPFFSLDFNQFSPNHFFASQMMRKLQEDALMHAESSSNPCTSKDSVSLLSSIIRSGLQAQAHAEATIAKAAALSQEPTEKPRETNSNSRIEGKKD